MSKTDTFVEQARRSKTVTDMDIVALLADDIAGVGYTFRSMRAGVQALPLGSMITHEDLKNYLIYKNDHNAKGLDIKNMIRVEGLIKSNSFLKETLAALEKTNEKIRNKYFELSSKKKKDAYFTAKKHLPESLKANEPLAPPTTIKSVSQKELDLTMKRNQLMRKRAQILDQEKNRLGLIRDEADLTVDKIRLGIALVNYLRKVKPKLTKQQFKSLIAYQSDNVKKSEIASANALHLEVVQLLKLNQSGQTKLNDALKEMQDLSPKELEIVFTKTGLAEKSAPQRGSVEPKSLAESSVDQSAELKRSAEQPDLEAIMRKKFGAVSGTLRLKTQSAQPAKPTTPLEDISPRATQQKRILTLAALEYLRNNKPSWAKPSYGSYLTNLREAYSEVGQIFYEFIQTALYKYIDKKDQNYKKAIDFLYTLPKDELLYEMDQFLSKWLKPAEDLANSLDIINSSLSDKNKLDRKLIYLISSEDTKYTKNTIFKLSNGKQVSLAQVMKANPNEFTEIGLLSAHIQNIIKLSKTHPEFLTGYVNKNFPRAQTGKPVPVSRKVEAVESEADVTEITPRPASNQAALDKVQKWSPFEKMNPNERAQIVVAKLMKHFEDSLRNGDIDNNTIKKYANYLRTKEVNLGGFTRAGKRERREKFDAQTRTFYDQSSSVFAAEELLKGVSSEDLNNAFQAFDKSNAEAHAGEFDTLKDKATAKNYLTKLLKTSTEKLTRDDIKYFINIHADEQLTDGMKAEKYYVIEACKILSELPQQVRDEAIDAVFGPKMKPAPKLAALPPGAARSASLPKLEVPAPESPAVKESGPVPPPRPPRPPRPAIVPQFGTAKDAGSKLAGGTSPEHPKGTPHKP